MSEDQQVVFEFARNSREAVRASLSTYHGRRRADLRIWTLDEEDVDRPTKRGINVAVEDLGKLAEAVRRLEEAAAA